MIKKSQMGILNWFKQTIKQTNTFSKIPSIIKNVCMEIFRIIYLAYFSL